MGLIPTPGQWILGGGDDRDIHFSYHVDGTGRSDGSSRFCSLYAKGFIRDKQLGYNESAVFDLLPGYNPL